MFGYSLLRANRRREFFNALMDEMPRVRHPDRGAAHRNRPRRLRGRDPVLARRSRRPTARSCSRPAPRRSARASASCRASWPSGARSTRAARATSTRACPTARRTCFYDAKGRARHEPAVRELPRRPGRGADGVRADVLADDQQLQAAGRRLLGAGQADLGRRQPHGELSRDRGLAEVDAARDALPGRRRQSLPRDGGRARRRDCTAWRRA